MLIFDNDFELSLFSSHYGIHTQRNCHHCPQTSQMDFSEHSYQCNGGTVHLCKGCGYDGYYDPLSVYDTDYLL